MADPTLYGRAGPITETDAGSFSGRVESGRRKRALPAPGRKRVPLVKSPDDPKGPVKTTKLRGTKARGARVVRDDVPDDVASSGAQGIELTAGERAWVWRMRRGMTLQDIADQYNVSKGVPVNWEAGRVTVPEDLRKKSQNVKLYPSEELRLLRRRAGIGARVAGRYRKVSHPLILELERAGDPELRRIYMECIARRLQTG